MTLPISTLTYAERANYCLSPLGMRLLQLLDEKKQTWLCLRM